MKKFLLGTVALIALAAAPAAAADLAARPYTKAPPAPIAAVYDWSGFYIGANGGWGSSRKCWDLTTTPWAVYVRLAEGCHDATGGTAGGQIGYRWQAGTWVFGLEAQGNWADFKGSNVSLFRSGAHQPVARRCVRPVHRSGRLRRQQRAVLRQGRRGRYRRSLPHLRYTHRRPGRHSRRRHPLGWRGRRRPRISASPRTGRPASNTTTCSCRTAPTASSTHRRSSCSRNRSHPPGRRSSSPSASTTAGAAR